MLSGGLTLALRLHCVILTVVFCSDVFKLDIARYQS